MHAAMNKLNSMRIQQKNLAEQMHRNFETEVSHMEMKLHKRLYDIRQALMSTVADVQVPDIDRAEDIITKTLQAFDEAENRNQLLSPRIISAQNFGSTEDIAHGNRKSHERLNQSMQRLDDMFSRQPSQESCGREYHRQKSHDSLMRPNYTRRQQQQPQRDISYESLGNPQIMRQASSRNCGILHQNFVSNNE